MFKLKGKKMIKLNKGLIVIKMLAAILDGILKRVGNRS